MVDIQLDWNNQQSEVLNSGMTLSQYVRYYIEPVVPDHIVLQRIYQLRFPNRRIV